MSHRDAFKRVEESEDYLVDNFWFDSFGLYIVARSGFDVSGALDYWERITLEHPWAIVFDKQSPDVRWSPYWRMRRKPLHGRMPYRAGGIRRTVSEITERLERGESLVP